MVFVISIVIPIYNEADNIRPMYETLRGVLVSMGEEYEIIFVDDGSTDRTREVIATLDVRAISFERNMGKSAALKAGFELAKGDIIIQLDGDNQYSPIDIPRMMAKLREGHDMVNGWRTQRYGTASRLAVSKVYNILSRLVFGLSVHDQNIGFKAYKACVVKAVIPHLGREMHRYIPTIAHLLGYGVAEIDVRHRPRLHGKSKYGFWRIFHGLRCLLILWWFKRKLMNASGREGVAGPS